MAEPADGGRNSTAVELCEYLRPALREGDDPLLHAGGGGDAAALMEYLTGGSGPGEGDLHRLMSLPPPPGSDAALAAAGAAAMAKAAATAAQAAAAAALAESEAAGKELRAAEEAVLNSEHALATAQADAEPEPEPEPASSSAPAPALASSSAPAPAAASAAAAVPSAAPVEPEPEPELEPERPTLSAAQSLRALSQPEGITSVPAHRPLESHMSNVEMLGIQDVIPEP